MDSNGDGIGDAAEVAVLQYCVQGWYPGEAVKLDKEARVYCAVSGEGKVVLDQLSEVSGHI